MSSHWKIIDNESQIQQIVSRSHHKIQLIFKHSTTCNISAIAKARLDGNVERLSGHIDFYYLDLLKFRSVSNYIAENLDVVHESPQIIVLHNGEVTHDESHLDIDIESISDHLEYLHSQ